MKRLAGFWKQIAEGWTVQRIAAVLIVVGVVVFVFGAVTQYCACVGWPNLGDVLNHMIGDFYANVSVDCLSIAFAILVIDRLNEQRAEREAQASLKARLIREMGSTNNGIALRAVRELRAQGWIEDGSLRKRDFDHANLRNANLKNADLQEARLINADLQGADLRHASLRKARLNYANLQDTKLNRADLQETGLQEANLQHANLDGANLQNAHISETNLQKAHLNQANCRRLILMKADLRGAYMSSADLSDSIVTDRQFVTFMDLQGTRMPSGAIYDGRYNLPYDIAIAGPLVEMVGMDAHQLIAEFHGVTVEAYLAGQEWARENLARVRRSAGLDPDTGLPVEPTNGTEPQPADAPAQPAPRRNGHKASMVAHRVRR